jgi:hypothetical protein
MSFAENSQPQKPTSCIGNSNKTNQRESGWKSGLPDKAFDLCADLGRRLGPKLGVRTLDTLHVACAVELKAQHFWTFDDRQARLAKAVGLKIL